MVRTSETLCEDQKKERKSEMATEKYVQAVIPQFDSHYNHWAMRMENLLRSKEYWHLIESGVLTVEGGAVPTEAQKETIEAQRLKDLKV